MTFVVPGVENNQFIGKPRLTYDKIELKGGQMKRVIGFIILGLLLSVPAFPQPAITCVKNGVRYGVTRGSFRSEWWNYQERGMSYMDGGCFEPALADIEKAIKLRTQMSRKECDQRRARTYGMHFVDYFGHRERGVALYRLGRLEEAKKELEFSLSCVESNKAQYYLDLVRKSRIESGALDKKNPDFEISQPKNKSYTNQSEIKVQGKAWDDTFVREIWIASEPVVIPIAEQQISFQQTVRLKSGWNNFRIRVIDLTGKENSAQWSVFLDQQGPEVSFLDIRPVSPGIVDVTGEIADDSPVAKFTLNGKEVPLQAGKTFSLRLTVAPEFKISFKASDLAGNQTDGVVNLGTGPKGAKLETHRPYQEASLFGDQQVYPERPYYQGLLVPASFGVQDMPRAEDELALVELYWTLKEKYDTYLDKDPPSIQLRGFKGETTVYFPELYLEGLIADASNLKEVTISGKNILKSQRKNMFFNLIIPLAQGSNFITIRAVDMNNNQAERVLRITRVVPAVHQLDERMVVSMLPFYQMSQVQEIGPMAYDNLITSIVNQRRFSFVDRSKVDAIVAELKLSQEQLIDPAYTLKVGKMTQAEAMILGYVKEAPDSIEVYAQLIDVETGQILTEKDAYREDKSLDSLKFLTRGLAIRLREAFPLLEGKVVKIDGKKITLDLGASQQLKPEMRVIFFVEQDITDVESGVSLGTATEKLGIGKIVEVYDKMSLAEAIGKSQTISAEEKVITK